MNEKKRVFAFKVLKIQHTRLWGQCFKLDVHLLSYFLDAKLKHCSEMKLKTKSVLLDPMTSKSEHFVVENCQIFIFWSSLCRGLLTELARCHPDDIEQPWEKLQSWRRQLHHPDLDGLELLHV